MLRKGTISFKAICVFVACAIFVSGTMFFADKLSQNSYASVLPYMPAPTKLIDTSPSFNPLLLRGLEFYPDDPMRLDFIVDQGDTKFNNEELKEESRQLIKYFLSALTIPSKDLWVNLSPYEQDRITSFELGLTDMGRDLLAEDYVLKQLTASLTYPESSVGKEFWDKVYKRAHELYGTTNIPINTFNKVWIAPEKAVVCQEGNEAFVKESSLKVMLEEDYAARGHVSPACRTGREAPPQAGNGTCPRNKDEISSEIMKKVVIPVIEYEVNHGANFTRLRQIYKAVILAAWFKKKLRQTIDHKLKTIDQKSGAIGDFFDEVYFDKKKIAGIKGDDSEIADKIYNQYIEAYKKGVYDYIKRDCDLNSRKTINRRYYSGGCTMEVDPEIENGDLQQVKKEHSNSSRVRLPTRLAKIIDQVHEDQRSTDEDENPSPKKKKRVKNFALATMFTLSLGGLIAGCIFGGDKSEDAADPKPASALAQKEIIRSELQTYVWKRHEIEMSDEEYEEIKNSDDFSGKKRIIYSPEFDTFIEQLKTMGYDLSSIDGNRTSILLDLFQDVRSRRIILSRAFSDFVELMKDKYNTNIFEDIAGWVEAYQNNTFHERLYPHYYLLELEKVQEYFGLVRDVDSHDNIYKIDESTLELSEVAKQYDSLKKLFPGMKEIDSLAEVNIMLEMVSDRKVFLGKLTSAKAVYLYNFLQTFFPDYRLAIDKDELDGFAAFLDRFGYDQLFIDSTDYESQESLIYQYPFQQLQSLRQFGITGQDIAFTLSRDKLDKVLFLAEKEGFADAYNELKQIYHDFTLGDNKLENLLTVDDFVSRPGWQNALRKFRKEKLDFDVSKITHMIKMVDRIEGGWPVICKAYDIARREFPELIDFYSFITSNGLPIRVWTLDDGFKRGNVIDDEFYGFLVNDLKIDFSKEDSVSVNFLGRYWDKWSLDYRKPDFKNKYFELLRMAGAQSTLEFFLWYHDTWHNLDESSKELWRFLHREGILTSDNFKKFMDCFKWKKNIELLRDKNFQELLKAHKEFFGDGMIDKSAYFSRELLDNEEIGENILEYLAIIRKISDEVYDPTAEKAYFLLNTEDVRRTLLNNDFQDFAMKVKREHLGLVSCSDIEYLVEIYNGINDSPHREKLMRVLFDSRYKDLFRDASNVPSAYDLRFRLPVIRADIDKYIDIYNMGAGDIVMREQKTRSDKGLAFDIINNQHLRELFRDRDRLTETVRTILKRPSQFRRRYGDGYWQQKEKYTERPDLNAIDRLSLMRIYLLDRALQDPQGIARLGDIVSYDTKDRSTEWGGIILMNDGNFLFREIKPVIKRSNNNYFGGNKGYYAPMKFHLHATRVDDSDFAGPSKPDLRSADYHGTHGVVITTLGLENESTMKINVDLYYVDPVQYLPIVIDMGIFTVPYNKNVEVYDILSQELMKSFINRIEKNGDSGKDAAYVRNVVGHYPGLIYTDPLGQIRPIPEIDRIREIASRYGLSHSFNEFLRQGYIHELAHSEVGSAINDGRIDMNEIVGLVGEDFINNQLVESFPFLKGKSFQYRAEELLAKIISNHNVKHGKHPIIASVEDGLIDYLLNKNVRVEYLQTEMPDDLLPQGIIKSKNGSSVVKGAQTKKLVDYGIVGSDKKEKTENKKVAPKKIRTFLERMNLDEEKAIMLRFEHDGDLIELRRNETSPRLSRLWINGKIVSSSRFLINESSESINTESVIAVDGFNVNLTGFDHKFLGIGTKIFEIIFDYAKQNNKKIIVNPTSNYRLIRILSKYNALYNFAHGDEYHRFNEVDWLGLNGGFLTIIESPYTKRGIKLKFKFVDGSNRAVCVDELEGKKDNLIQGLIVTRDSEKIIAEHKNEYGELISLPCDIKIDKTVWETVIDPKENRGKGDSGTEALSYKSQHDIEEVVLKKMISSPEMPGSGLSERMMRFIRRGRFSVGVALTMCVAATAAALSVGGDLGLAIFATIIVLTPLATLLIESFSKGPDKNKAGVLFSSAINREQNDDNLQGDVVNGGIDLDVDDIIDEDVEKVTSDLYKKQVIPFGVDSFKGFTFEIMRLERDTENTKQTAPDLAVALTSP